MGSSFNGTHCKCELAANYYVWKYANTSHFQAIPPSGLDINSFHCTIAINYGVGNKT